MRVPLTRDEIDAQYARREALFAEATGSGCSVCGRGMMVVRRLVEGAYQDVITCPANSTHQGHRKRRSLTQMVRDGDASDPFVSARLEKRRREELENQIGTTETQALIAYGSERLPMTAMAAERAIRALWPGAGQAAKEKAILICAQYNLNPLMKELYIIPFGTSEEVVLGIDATRKIARQRTPYSYKDGPRPLSAEEMEAIGEDPKTKVGVICVLETPAGGRFPGYGFWARGIAVKGADKGNTPFNMASYRSERNALKRLVPDAELPAPVGMFYDGVYADITEIEEAPKTAPPRTERHQPASPPVQAPADASSKASTATTPELAPSASQDAPKGIGVVVVEEDFLAISDIEQANLLIETVKEFGRDKWVKLRQEIGLPVKTAIDLTPEQRLTALKAIVGAKVS